MILPEETGDGLADLCFQRFDTDVLGPAGAALVSPHQEPTIRTYRFFEYRELVTAVALGVTGHYFGWVKPLEWLSWGLTPLDESVPPTERLSAAEEVRRVPRATAALEGSIRAACHANRNGIRPGGWHQTPQAIGTALYTAHVHAKDEEVQELMAAALFSLDEEWVSMLHGINALVSAADTSERRLALLTQLPSWTVDGVARWRHVVSHLCEELIGLPIETHRQELLQLLGASLIDPRNRELHNVLSEMAAPSVPANESLHLAVRMFYLSIDPRFEPDVRRTRFYEMPRRGPDEGFGTQLVQSMSWRLLPDSRTMKRMAELEKATAPLVESLAQIRQGEPGRSSYDVY